EVEQFGDVAAVQREPGSVDLIEEPLVCSESRSGPGGGDVGEAGRTQGWCGDGGGVADLGEGCRTIGREDAFSRTHGRAVAEPARLGRVGVELEVADHATSAQVRRPGAE